jgi:hypothetical protein
LWPALLVGSLLLSPPARADGPEPLGEARPTAPRRSPAGKPPARSRAPLVSIRSHQLNKDGTLTLELDVLTPTPGEEVAFRSQIDGQTVRELAPAQVKTRNLALTEQYTLTLPVHRRDFVLSLVAVRKDGSQSEPVELRIKQAAIDTRPFLHVLAVGIGRYDDAEIPQLRYPAKDARDMAAVFMGQRDDLYRAVDARVLTDQEAGRAAILADLQRLEQRTREEDTAVVFLAGHGTNDPDGTYYFLPYGARTDKSTLLSGTDLQEALRKIRGRVILLLDTCHSGGVLGRRSLTRLINEMITENRIVVFAASTGEQTSQESTAWRNGAFTKALSEALRGAADYQPDGILMLSEIETWVGLRVKELTQGSQTPALAKPNATPDYQVAALPEHGLLKNPQTQRRQRLAWGLSAAAVVIASGLSAAAAVAVGLQQQAGGGGTYNLVFKPAGTSGATTAAVTVWRW